MPIFLKFLTIPDIPDKVDTLSILIITWTGEMEDNISLAHHLALVSLCPCYSVRTQYPKQEKPIRKPR